MGLLFHYVNLSEGRVTRLERAGVRSIRDLYNVLAALDLGLKMEIVHPTPTSAVPLPEAPEQSAPGKKKKETPDAE